MPTVSPALALGATVQRGGAEFRVWAPNQQHIVLRLIGGGEHPMRRHNDGFFTATLPARAGQRYFYVLDNGLAVPDPVSRLLPEGVHGPTEIVDPEAFRWSDSGWRGLDLREYVLYELHVGTCTPAGTFDGVIGELERLRELGITALELMPVAAFPGTRNWGYDGASPYAVQASYGGPENLKRLVDAAHRAGLAVVQDEVYNHLGPEGNYLGQFGPYYTDRHRTPWGDAINYDGADAAQVRRYFVENALYWIREYHMDGLRLDAVQEIHDDSPRHIIGELAEAVHALGREVGRTVCVMAETDENDARYLRPPPRGYGVDAVWSDDFHHALHTLLTSERQSYYQDFGRPELLVRALNEGFAFQGEPFAFWDGRPRGGAAADLPLYAHIICTQNHDQVGNRAQGDRLTHLLPRGARRLAAALLLLAPHTPLLFMGQEYDEQRPFLYFTDHGDPRLREAVSRGRRSEFPEFAFEEVPDPQEVDTFQRSQLSRPPLSGPQEEMREWYRALLDLRRRFVTPGDRTCRAEWREGVLSLQVPRQSPRLLVLAGFAGATLHDPGGEWIRVLHSAEDEFAVRVYHR